MGIFQNKKRIFATCLHSIRFKVRGAQRCAPSFFFANHLLTLCNTIIFINELLAKGVGPSIDLFCYIYVLF